MEIRLVRQVIAGLILSGFVFLLSGCGGALISTNARDLPDEVNAKISRGDTRQKVHSVMGTPWVEVPTLGVDIYYQSGRDIVVILSPVPLPIPDEKVSAAVLVSYDHEGLVDEVVSELATVYDEPCISSRGLSLIKAGTDELDTILAPPIDLETLVDISPMEGDCSLVLIMGECPMREVLVDNSQIADLGNAEGYCPWDDAPWRSIYKFPSCGEEDNHYFYRTFVRKDISAGTHRLTIRQKKGSFETDFDCESGETVYAKLNAQRYSDFWSGYLLKGEILIDRHPPEFVVGVHELRPIMWHRGTWYWIPDSPKSNSK